MTQVSTLFEAMRPRSWHELVGNSRVKTQIRTILETRMTNAVLFYGSIGSGKTTCARLLAAALRCEDRGPTHDPCGRCEPCRRPVSLITCSETRAFNCASLTSAELIETTRELHHVVGTYVIHLDELHRATDRIEHQLLTMLEDSRLATTFFILSTSDPEKVEPALHERVVPIGLEIPTVEEVLPFLERACRQAGFRSWTPDALRGIATEQGCHIRRCLNALIQRRSLSDELH